MAAQIARPWSRHAAAQAKGTVQGEIEKLSLLLVVCVNHFIFVVNDKIIHIYFSLLETAMLLPGKYSQKRVKNYDVRHNLKSYKKPDTTDQ